ncbi:MAG: threonine/serine exporter family protein [Chloroflexota bacterium]
MIKEYSPSELIEALNVVARVGILMLQSGASSFRAKDIMDRIAAKLAIEQLDTFVTPTKMIVIVNNGQANYTRAFKVPSLGVNMARVSALEVLSRAMADSTSPAELTKLVDEIEQRAPEYPRFVVIGAVAIACGAFAVILGGGLPEFATATCAAAVAQWLRFRMIALRLSPYLIAATCSAIAATISFGLVHLLNAPLPHLGLIASVLLLVPGVPLVTAILDFMHFDFISGMARSIFAALILVNIGIGMLVVLVLTGFSIL